MQITKKQAESLVNQLDGYYHASKPSFPKGAKTEEDFLRQANEIIPREIGYGLWNNVFSRVNVGVLVDSNGKTYNFKDADKIWAIPFKDKSHPLWQLFVQWKLKQITKADLVQKTYNWIKNN